MSDILKQIQALQEQFSNLFEVEGLGNPAVDVPPSQNKIKKDVKTKDGKAELVSVEDELFPYDGNKREQYRQKILDTINGMIQGTSTLEDLLQIVRQKKAPLKEAMEIVEELLSEGYNLHQVVARAHAKKGHRFFKDNGLPKVSVSPEDIEKEEKLAKILGDKDKTKELADKALEVPDSKEYKKHVSGDARNIFVGGNTDSNLGYKDKIALSQDTNGSRAEERQINKSKGRHYRKLAKMNKSEALKEAVELMEDLFSTILKQPDEKQGALVYKYHQVKNKENAGKDTYTQAKEEEKRKSKEEKGQEKTEQRKKYKGKSVEDWKLGRLMDQIARNAKNLGKVEDSATAKAVRRNAQKADLKEALEIMEAIINEVSVGKWKEAAASSLPKRQEEAEAAKAAAEKGWEEYDKVSREHPEDEPALYRLAQSKDEEAEKAEDKADHAYAVTRLKTHGKANANKAIKAAKKVQDKREDEFGRNPEKRTFLRSGKANQLTAADPVKSRADEALEEALAIINEVSKEFLKDKDDKAKVKVLKAIIRHGETMTPENPEGDPELLKIRQDSIDRLKKYREKCKDYLEKKEKRNDK